jgi:phage I-like protein
MKDENGILFAANGLVIDPATKQLPPEVEVFVEGNHGRKQRQDGTVIDIVISAADIDACVAHMESRRARHPNRDFVIDYEHQTLQGHEAPAAGWFSGIRAATRDGKKIALANVTQWTKRASEYILNGEYRYISPVFAMNGIDKETRKQEPLILINLGITNEPFFDSLLPIATTSFFETTTIKGKDTVMDETMSWLRSFLNLPLTATPQDILTELNKLAAQIQASIGAAAATTAKDLMTYLGNVKSEIAAKADLMKEICGKDTGTVEEAKATYVTAKGAIAELVAAKEELATLKNAQVVTAFEGVIAKAFTDGKILPVQKSDAGWLDTQKAFAMKDMTAFTAFWDKQPKIAPTGPLPQTEPAAVAAKDDLSAEALEIGAKVGLSRDTMLKYGK